MCTKSPLMSGALSAIPAAVILGLSGPAHADKITDGIAGWNMDNVEVYINDTAGLYNETTGEYPPEYEYFRSDVSNPDTGNVTAAVRGKDWPVGEPPGIKIVNSTSNLPFANGKPSNCIMTTSYLEEGYLDSTTPIQTTCDSGFQTHKRFKANMLPASLNEPVDLVFNVEATAEDRYYQVFQKINNYTGSRLSGFTIQIGTGTGGSFVVADPAQLALAIPSDIWDDEDLATFAHGLFGPSDKHFPDPGFFDDVRAGFNVEIFDGTTAYSGLDRGVTDATTGAPLIVGHTIRSTTPMASNYDQAPPTGPADQFGEWIHSGQVPYGIFFDDDNDPTTDAELVAFWGATDAAGTTFGWISGEQTSWAVIDPAAEGWWDNALYSVGPIEDLLNLGPNYMVALDETFTETSFTLRITPVAAADNTDPAYVNSPPVVATQKDGIVVIGPNPVAAGGTLSLRVNDIDLIAGAPEDVVVENLNTGETETVTLTGELDGVRQGSLATSIDATADNGNDSGALAVTVGDTIEVTYTDSDDGQGGINVPKTAQTVVVANDGTVAIAPNPVAAGGTLSLIVNDGDFLTGATVDVTVTNTRTGEIESVVLTATSYGILTGSLDTSFDATTDGGDNSGALAVNGGDTLQVTYTDTSTSSGTPQDKTAQTIVVANDGTVAIAPNPLDKGDTLTLTVNDGDFLTGATVEVTVTNTRTGETESVTLSAANDGVLNGSLATSLAFLDIAANTGTLYVDGSDTVTVSYTDAANTTGSAVVRTASTQVPADPLSPKPSGGGCTIAPSGNDWSLPLLLASLFGYGWLRRRKSIEVRK